MQPRTLGLASVCGLVAASCATSSASNFSISYHAVGAATDTAPLNAAAEKAFNTEVVAEDQKLEISRVKVFLDSIPPELTMKDGVVGIAAGAAATLVGSVELKAIWKAPDDVEVLPALQRAAQAAQANIAFCPTSQKPAGHIWRCFLVKSTPTGPRPNATEL